MEPTETNHIDPSIAPSGTGCAECLAGHGAGWWFHLRRCAQCGKIGCCDSSPSQHSTNHAHTAGHPVLTSFEPGETWFWNAETEETFEGPKLAAPRSRPESQPVPGPEGQVPSDWRNQLRG